MSSPWTQTPGRKPLSTCTRLGRQFYLQDRCKRQILGINYFDEGSCGIVTDDKDNRLKKRVIIPDISYMMVHGPMLKLQRNDSFIQVRSLLTNCTYLEDESVEVRKFKLLPWILLNDIGLNITGLPDWLQDFSTMSAS